MECDCHLDRPGGDERLDRRSPREDLMTKRTGKDRGDTLRYIKEKMNKWQNICNIQGGVLTI